MHKFEALDLLGVRIRIVEVGNHYRFHFRTNGVSHSGVAPSRDGAIAMAYDRVRDLGRPASSGAA